jgi:hypothetical protein
MFNKRTVIGIGSQSGYTAIYFGSASDKPVPADSDVPAADNAPILMVGKGIEMGQ